MRIHSALTLTAALLLSTCTGTLVPAAEQTFSAYTLVVNKDGEPVDAFRWIKHTFADEASCKAALADPASELAATNVKVTGIVHSVDPTWHTIFGCAPTDMGDSDAVPN